MKSLYLALFLSLSTVVMAVENQSPAAQAVDTACASEAQVAGCGQAKVGTGMLKCIEQYHRTHKDFKVSHECKRARRNLHETHEMKNK